MMSPKIRKMRPLVIQASSKKIATPIPTQCHTVISYLLNLYQVCIVRGIEPLHVCLEGKSFIQKEVAETNLCGATEDSNPAVFRIASAMTTPSSPWPQNQPLLLRAWYRPWPAHLDYLPRG